MQLSECVYYIRRLHMCSPLLRLLLVKVCFRCFPHASHNLAATFYAYFPELLTASNGGSLIGAIVALISAGGAVGVLWGFVLL
jgi:hypothetical protein